MLEVRVLGSVSATRDGVRIDIGSTKQRLVLALLAANPTGVARARLVDALWPDDPPPTASGTLMGYVSRLRAALGSEAIVAHGDGYRLAADLVDAWEVDARLAAGDLAGALALWEGDAFGELGDHPLLLGEAARLRELRSDARVRIARLHLTNGDAARAISMLESLVDVEPLREDAWVLLAGGLLDAGRAAEAVRTAHRCRRQLADVGMEPSAALVDVEQRALLQRSQDVEVEPLRYARCSAHVAYQVAGRGPIDVVLSSYGSVSIDSFWDGDHVSAFVRRLAARTRVVLYDTRGVGLSDPIDVQDPPTIDEQADDVACVLATVGPRRSVVVGVGDGGPTAITYASRRPEAVVGLVLVNTFARLVEADDHAGVPRAAFDANIALSVDPDGARDTAAVLRNHAPSVADDGAFRRWWDRAGRRGASPATAAALWRVRYGADVRALLPSVGVPTLVLHRRRTRVVPFAQGAYLAEHIPGARFVPLDGADQPPFTDAADEIADLITSFALGLA